MLIFFNLKHRSDKSFKHDNSESHRDYITHVPLFWFITSMIIVSFGFIFNSIFTEYFGWIILIGTLSHFILDSIEYGIRWLSPISTKNFALKSKIPTETITDRPGSLLQYFHYLIRTYWKTATIWCEIMVSIIALIVLLK